jgi:hypothetical protein
MKFYVTERLGPSRSLTHEGFLLCQGVPIARTGVMDYLESELPGIEGDRGIIRVQRNEDEVFKPEAIASFAGKPVVNDHPDDDVTPVTWRRLAIGTILNPRRGEANLADVLIADLLITDADGIQLIQDGKVEVSCGYDAEYEQIRPGLARQHNIIGNHTALVEAGRCGPRCSIGDHAISVTLENQMSKAVVKKPLSFRDRLMAAFKAKDEAAVEKLAGEVTEDDQPIAENEVTGSGQHIHVHVNSGNGGGATEGKTDDAEDPEAGKEDPFKKFTDEMQQCMKDMGERLTKLEGGGAATANAEGDEDEDDDVDTTADAEGEEDDTYKDKGKTKDGKGKTRDSAGLADAFKDTIARAEILAPGIKLPTFDAKADRKKTVDALCGFRRKALDKAYTTDEGKAAIDPLLAARTLDTKKLTCDAARIMFTAASENMKAVNRAATTGTGRIRAGDTGTVKVATIGDMNKAATDFWKPKA